MYFRRLKIIRLLLKKGFKLVIAGLGWSYLIPHAGKGFYGVKYVTLNRLSKIVLNIHIDTDIGYKANMRVFEIPSFGSLEVTDNPNVIKKFYEPGLEVFTYNTVEELSRLLKDLLSYEAEEICKVVKRAFVKTVEKHTYFHRALKIINECKRRSIL